MIINGSNAIQEIELTDVVIYLTQEQAEVVLWHLKSFKEQEKHAPLPENEAIIDGDIVEDVFVKNSIEMYHRK